MGSSLSERIYSLSPLWLQDLLITAKGLEFRFRRTNDAIINEQYLCLLGSQYWSREKIRRYQVEQLRRLLSVAFNNVPYYKELQKQLGCQVEDFQQPEDIRLLPVLEKSQVRGQEHLFLNTSIDLKLCNNFFTSGTTGTPINLYETRESFSRRLGFVARLRHWAGLNNCLHPKRAQFTGRSIIPCNQNRGQQVYWRWNRFQNSLLFSTVHISPDSIRSYAKALVDFQPELIDGYPSAILLVARLSNRLGLKLPKPKAIIVSAETLLPEHRHEIAEVFSCKVFNQYAATEPSCFWCDCEYGTMHENPEYGISEVVDLQGKSLPLGEPGDVVLTSFLNSAMILIRYRLGDVAVRGDDTPCLCQRVMPRIAGIEGRLDDILFVPQRGYVGRLDPAFKGLSNIIEAQIIQEDFENINILLVPDAGFTEEIGLQLVHNLHEKLGDKVNIQITLVDKIPRGPNGKFRAVLSKIKHLYPESFSG